MLILERFEGSLAVIETDGGHLSVSRALLPDDAREGDVLLANGDRYEVDARETANRRARVLRLQKSLFKPKG